MIDDRVIGVLRCFGAIDMTTTTTRILGASRMEQRIHGGGSGNNYRRRLWFASLSAASSHIPLRGSPATHNPTTFPLTPNTIVCRT